MRRGAPRHANERRGTKGRKGVVMFAAGYDIHGETCQFPGWLTRLLAYSLCRGLTSITAGNEPAEMSRKAV